MAANSSDNAKQVNVTSIGAIFSVYFTINHQPSQDLSLLQVRKSLGHLKSQASDEPPDCAALGFPAADVPLSPESGGLRAIELVRLARYA